jgi:hypothetical protein
MAAGLGFKTFTTGEVLTAADTNGYLMQGVLVFASSAARAAAVTSPQEGQYSYLKDTNSTEYYDGAAWIAAPIGDITGVTAGVGITGGGTSGTVTVTNDMATTITAAGDIVVGTGSGTYDNLPIGTTAQVLTADTTVSPYKVKWATPAASSPTFVGCSIYQAGAGQTPANATDTLLTFDAEFFDSNGFHSTSTNTGRVTIPVGYAGKYLVNYAVRAVANGTGYRTLTLYKNGTSYVQFMDEVANGSVTSYPARSIILNLAEGDYLTFYYYQNSGGGLTIYVREYEMPVQVSWLGA